MHKVHQLFGGLHYLYGTEVDATEHNTVVLRGFDVCLQRGLTIQFDGQIDDVATFHKTVGRGVCPASGDVDTNGRAPPDDLIVGDLFSRKEEGGARPKAACYRRDARRRKEITRGDSMAEQGEGLVTVATEHGIVDTGHEGGFLRERRRQGDVFLLELRSGISKVELIEDTVAPVVSQGTPVLFTEGLALSKEPTQVCALCQFVAVQGFVNAITTNLGGGTRGNRHDINTLTWCQGDVPIVFWHTGNDMVVGEMPTLANVAVLNPDVAIFLRERNLHHGILHEDRGMWLAIEMHNLTLIVHEILKPQR